MVSIAAVLAFGVLALFPTGSAAAPPPSGFVTQSIGGLSGPTAMAIAPDTRIFIAQQGGALRVVRNGVLLSTPFVQLTVDANGERGLLGVAVDPGFMANNFVYVYYTATSPTIHNRVSRFTANGDVAAPASEQVILDLPPLSAATNHNGGAIHFGPDGKLYIAVGENGQPDLAQQLNQPFGKLLRINRDGTVPSDNPFNDGGGANYDAIWAFGLRNPFTFAFQFGSNRLFANDVGQTTWEEINDITKGGNYGWPVREGNCVQGSTTSCGAPPPGMINPIYSYPHTEGCAITGAAFYGAPPANLEPFPGDYFGNYFFGDLCSGFVRRLGTFGGLSGPATFMANDGNVAPVDMAEGVDGSLYILARNQNALLRVRFNPIDWKPVRQARPDGTLKSGPAAATMFWSAAGAQTHNAFVLGTDNNIYWTRAVGNGGFGPWTALGGPPGGAVGEPAVAAKAPDHLDLFVRGSDNRLWQRFSRDGGLSWSSWILPVPDGVLASSPTVSSWASDRLDVFVTGTDGQIYQRFFQTANWSSTWIGLGKPPTGNIQGAPAATSTTFGRIDMFVRGADNRLWQQFWGGTSWSGWLQPPGTQSGTLASSPSVAPFPYLPVFARGTDGHLYTTSFYNGAWSTWMPIGGGGDVLVGPPGATSDGFGTEAYVRGTDNRLYEFVYGH